MLAVNLRHVETHEIHLEGELSVEDLDFGLDDEMIRAEQPLRYDLTVQKLGHALLAQGRLQVTLNCQCVRCLTPFERPVALPHWTLLLPLAGDERPAVHDDCVDLTPFVREDMLLEFPAHPLCRPGCAGLKAITTAAARTAGERERFKSSAWAELDKLKL
ncbi:MAG: DUF177 domain-containing protein [Verrucomicrobiota bacterium]|nr:DUF177 domain-containing protein [Verrucomicrobiota bacterium]